MFISSEIQFLELDLKCNFILDRIYRIYRIVFFWITFQMKVIQLNPLSAEYNGLNINCFAVFVFNGLYLLL